jgi:anthranilate/para-aminobenzoate synthase component II
MTNNGKTLATNQAATNSLRATIIRNGNSLTERNKLVIKENILTDLQDGADVNAALAEFYYALDIEFLEATKDLLLDHPKSNLSHDKFLELTLKASVTKYDSKTQKHVADLEKLKLQGTLIKSSLNHGADISTNTYISLEALSAHKDLLLDHPKSNLSPNKFLELALRESVTKYDSETQKHVTDSEKIKLQSALIKCSLDRGAVINADLQNISLEALSAHKDLLLNHPKNNLSPDKFLEIVLKASITTWNSDAQKSVIDPEKIKLQDTLIGHALDHGAAINTDADEQNISLEALSAHKDLLLEHPTSSLDASKFLSLVFGNHEVRYSSDTPKQALKRSSEKTLLIKSLAKYAIDKGADLNTKDSSEEFALTLFEQLFVSNMFDIIDYVQNKNENSYPEPSMVAWIAAIDTNFNISFISNALQKFPNGFSEEELFELARSHGASLSAVHTMLDTYHLAIDFNKAKADENVSALSKTELQILDPDKSTSIPDCKNGHYQNPYGFSPLLLALISGKHELAIEIIENGHNLTEKSTHGITPVSIISLLADNSKSQSVSKLLNSAFKKLDTLDVVVNEEGESLIDAFLGDGEIKDEALKKTNDPLFTFYKPDADLYTPLLHTEKTHIAISMGEGFWSTGLNSLSRLISRDHHDVTFHLITLEMMEKGGDKFINQFNGWINPGAGDSFPKGKAEFNKHDWKQSMRLEQTYQKALDKTYEFKIPYLGMCAGAQHLVLFHDGYVQPAGDSVVRPSVTYIKGTLSHFMSITHEQQSKSLKYCEFPKISFKGDAAYTYAAVPDKLGEELQLGAMSEDGFTMAYSHKNGLRYATQFHPEHYYYLQKDGEVNHQKAWFENFIHLTKLHHDHVQNGSPHPESILADVSERLNECLEAPTCLPEQNKFSNSTIGEMLFDY